MKVLVIGSGLAGVAAAWFLRQNGAQVTVLDRREAAALETSFANAGMLAPSMSGPWNEPGLAWKLLKRMGRQDSPMHLRPTTLASMAGWCLHFLRNSKTKSYRKNRLKNLRLANYSLGALRKLRDDLGLQYDHLTNGTLKIFRDQTTMDEFVHLAELPEEHGVDHHRLDSEALVEFEPSLAPVRHHLVGGLHYPNDESGDAHMFCQSLAETARRAGVEFRFGTSVCRLVAEGGRVLHVETDRGPLDADVYLMAAGSYSPLLLKGLGINLPVRPVKGYSITVPFGDWRPRPQLPLVDETVHMAATPLGDRLRVAGMAEMAGWDTAAHGTRIHNILEFVRSLLPTFHDQFVKAETNSWAGLRPMSADGVAVIGKTPLENLFLNTGHGHLGWTMSSGSGKLVADLIVHGRTDLDLAPYELGRFR
jgi:D-amino-acid dehydrogenase